MGRAEFIILKYLKIYRLNLSNKLGFSFLDAYYFIFLLWACCQDR